MTFEMPDTVYDAFQRTAQTWPARDMLCVMPSTAQKYGIEAGALSYRAAQEHVQRYAQAFKGAGYTSGMRVAVLLENRPDFFLVWLAMNSLGLSVVPINPDLRRAELEYLLSHSEPALVIAIASRHLDLRQAIDRLSFDLPLVKECCDLPPPRDGASVAEPKSGQAQEAAVLYTSGTTGNPKGCVLPNSYFLLAGAWYAKLGGLATLSKDGERMITPLPIFHMNAMAYSFMAMITVGGCLIALDRFHPSTWWDDVARSEATCLHYLGVMPSMLMNAPARDSDRAHQIKFGFGAGVDPKLQAPFEDRFDFPLVEAWAMTETGAGAVIAASTQARSIGVASLGIPQSDLAISIVDHDGQEVAQGQSGELLVRRAEGDPKFGFFSHYYKNPEATAEAWAGGWFHTGDLVMQNASGEVFFVDRKKNMIRRSGENIAAVEVESILMKHPLISAVAVCAVADETRGDEVFALIVSTEPSKATAQSIMDWSLQEMAYYKAPGYISFTTELPLTPTQKIQRAVLKSQAEELLKDPKTIKTAPLKRRQVA